MIKASVNGKAVKLECNGELYDIEEEMARLAIAMYASLMSETDREEADSWRDQLKEAMDTAGDAYMIHIENIEEIDD